MGRRLPKSLKIVSDRDRSWSERVAIARKAVEQMPGDWKRDTLAKFLDEAEQALAAVPEQAPTP